MSYRRAGELSFERVFFCFRVGLESEKMPLSFFSHTGTNAGSLPTMRKLITEAGTLLSESGIAKRHLAHDISPHDALFEIWNDKKALLVFLNSR